MNLMSLYNKIQYKFFSTPMQIQHKIWVADCGDQNIRLNIPLDDQAIVFDVGGYLGQWSSDIYSKYLPTIYIFEVFPIYSKKIKSRFVKNNDIKVFDFGLSGKNENVTISDSGDATSVFKSPQDGVRGRLVDVVEFCKDYKIEKIDLIKINIEGGEYCLLERIISSGLILKIKYLQIQFHDFVPNACQLRKELVAKLDLTHKVEYSYPFVWEGWRIKDVCDN